MERELGKDVEAGKKRITFLMDNCDAVEDLTGILRLYRPEDPVIYDYALFGIGIENKTNNNG